VTIAINFLLNGRQHQCAVAAHELACEALRGRLHLTGLHVACGEGICGACTILLDDRPVRSCLLLAAHLEGRTVVTIEGLQDMPIGRRIQEALIRHNAFQCGYCASGVVFALYELLQGPPPGADAESTVRSALSAAVCRCTGYVGMVEAGLELVRPGSKLTSSDKP
jgi:carbon-monoxide dehydrogenase small subunit